MDFFHIKYFVLMEKRDLFILLPILRMDFSMQIMVSILRNLKKYHVNELMPLNLNWKQISQLTGNV